MAVNSKFISEQKLVSYFDSVPFTCYELGHTWEPKCYMSFLQTVRDSMKFSIKLYIGFYLATYLLKMRKKKYRKFAQLKKFPLEVIQSSIFLAANGSLFMGGYCLLRNIVGRFYGWHPAVVGILCGYMSISMEKKSRRGVLALYLANLSAETLYKIAIARGMLKPLKNIEVAIFSAASTGFMSLFRKPNGLNEEMRSPLSFLVGSSEGGSTVTTAQTHSNLLSQRLLRVIHPVVRILKSCHQKHALCPHQHSCACYLIEGSLRNFLFGYSIQVGINLLQVIRGKQKFSKAFKDFSLGLFLGGYNALFRAINCLLRWLRNKDSPEIHGAVAGGVAGIASYFYKSSTISLYLLFKLFETYARKACDKGWLPAAPNADKWLYSFSLAVLLHAACLEPHVIRPAYWRFLQGVSGQKFPVMFRKLYDLFGTQASTLYPDFVPDLDPKYVVSPFVIEVLKIHGKWRGNV